MGLCEIICGDCGRSSVFLLTAGGIVCSYFSMMSCEFFSFTNRDPEILPPPYFNITSGYVGLFNHFDYENGRDDVCDQTYSNFFVVSNDDFNIYFKIAQFAAIVGPAGALLSFFLNMMEWCCCKMTATFFITFFLLFLGFVGQGLTFMIYGQTEFCFNDNATEECGLELGAYLSIAAASAFYLASVIWCCMPRTVPIMQRGRKDTSNADRDLEMEEAPPPPVPPVDRGAPPQAEGAHSWQNYEKTSFQQQQHPSGSNDWNDEPQHQKLQQQENGSTQFAGAPMGGSATQQQQQYQQQSSSSFHDTSNPYAPDPPQGQQVQPTVSEEDFANPFEEGADVQNYERPTPSAYADSHP